MDKEDIIRMAREAGCLLPGKGGDPNGLWEPNGWENVTDLMFKFATLVAAYERDECAKVCEEQIKSYMNKQYTTDPLGGFREKFSTQSCAAAIRSRGEK